MADEQPPENDFVYVRLGADTKGLPGRVTRAAYEMIWKGKGFTIVDTNEAELALSPQTQAEMAGAEATTKKKG